MSNMNQSETHTKAGEVRENLSSDIEQIRKLGEERLDDLRELGGQIRRRVESEIKRRPLAAVGIAFGAGVVASSLMSSRLARLAILAAGGYAAREMVGDRLFEVLGSEEQREGEEVPRRRRESRHRGESR